MALDLTDKKILFELDRNSRQNISNLAKILKKSQQVIAYRINKLVKEGIITSFLTTFSTKSIGIPLIIKVYLQFKGITEKKETELYTYLLKHPDVNWVAKTLGDYDLFVSVMVKDIEVFAEFKTTLFEKYGVYFNNYEISFLQSARTFQRNYLLNKNPLNSEFSSMHTQTNIFLKDLDKKIMIELSENSRITAIELSKKLKLNVKTTISKLKTLEKIGAIQGYRININRQKIGIKYYKVFIKLSSYNPTQVNKLKSFCYSQQYIIHFIENIGKYELELEIEMPSSEKMQELVKEIRNSFSETIAQIETTEILEELKLVWLPQRFK